MTRILASLLVLGLVLVSPAFAADSTKTAKGTVKTVAADSLTVTDSAGKDWTFAVDTKTKVIATRRFAQDRGDEGGGQDT